MKIWMWHDSCRGSIGIQRVGSDCRNQACATGESDVDVRGNRSRCAPRLSTRSRFAVAPPTYFARPYYYRPYPYALPAPFFLGFGYLPYY